MTSDLYIDTGWLLKGGEIAVGKDNPIRILNPTLEEIICGMGEKLYYQTINTLTANPSSLKVMLNDSLGLDYTTITDYELFLILFETLQTLNTSCIFAGLNFKDMKKVVIDDKCVLQHKRDEWILDEKLYKQIINILCKVHHIEQNIDLPGNKHAKTYLINRDRKRLARIKRESYSPYLSFLIEKLVNCAEFKYDFNTVWNLNIYAFLNSVMDIDQLKNYQFLMTGAYSGMVEIKQSTISRSHWLTK